MASRFWLRLEPYDPDARDGDGDGIVQERTAWERPVGTRIIDDIGQDLRGGQVSPRRKESFRIVDRDGKAVDYIPSYAKQAKIPTERPKTSLEKRGVQTIQSRGIRSLDEVVTEAVALSRASAPGSPQPDDTPSPQGIPTEQPRPPKELTAGPELVADLKAAVRPIQALAKARSDGFLPASKDIGIIRVGGRSSDLFGWEETPAGTKALDAIFEAGDRALAFLEQSLARVELTDEIRKEIDDIRKQVGQSKDNRERVQLEIRRLRYEAWLTTLNDIRKLLPASDDGTTTDSQQKLDGMIKSATRKLANFDRDGKINEIITKKDFEILLEVFNAERTRALQKYIKENDGDNYERWFDTNGKLISPPDWASTVSGDDDDLYIRLMDEEGARRNEVLKDARYGLAEQIYKLLTDDDEVFPLGDVRGGIYGRRENHLLGRYIKSDRRFPAKESRDILSELLVRELLPQELADLEAQLEKPDFPVALRKRLNEIDPLSNPDENAKAFLKLLSLVRSDVGTGDFLGYFDQSKIEANGEDAGITGITKEIVIEGIKEVNSKLPGTWISRFRQDWGDLRRNDLKFIRRGHFEAGRIRLSNGRYSWRSTLLHEVTHGFESSVPGLYLAERLFYNRRARSIPKNKLVKKYYGTGQYYWDLQLSDNYASVYYIDKYLEIATMSIETLYAGEIRNMPIDQAKFIIGCMLLL